MTRPALTNGLATPLPQARQNRRASGTTIASTRGGKRKRGRPSKRTKKLEEELLAWIASGETLRDFCRQEGRPSKSTVYVWLNSDPGFSGRFALARDQGQEEMSEKAYGEMWADHTGPDGRVDPGRVQLTRMRVWGTVQLLAKWNPGRWGNRVALAGDESAPIRTISDSEAARQIARLLARASARKARAEANGASARLRPAGPGQPVD